MLYPSFDLHLTSLLTIIFPQNASSHRIRFFCLALFSGLTYLFVALLIKPLINYALIPCVIIDVAYYSTCAFIIYISRSSITGASFIVNEWENPRITNKNRYMDKRTFSSGVGKINGSLPPLDLTSSPPNATQWTIHEFPTVTQALTHLSLKDPPPTKFRPVTVPSNVQLQQDKALAKHLSKPIYTNTKYPFPTTPPFVPTANPTAVYKTSFKLPPKARPSDHRFHLLFKGVAPCFYLYVNGRKVGYASDGCLPSEFDVTSYVNRNPAKPNDVWVVVPRWCCFSYLEDQDHWWLSGIYRGVELRSFRRDIVVVDDYYVSAEEEVRENEIIMGDIERQTNLQD